VLTITVDRQAGLRKRTRGDEDDRQVAARRSLPPAIDWRFWNPRHERTYVGLTPLPLASHECADLRVNTMQLETKFLRLRTPVTLGSRFGDWHVTWLGGWSKYRLFYLVMVVRLQPLRGTPAPRNCWRLTLGAKSSGAKPE
jgi:hypothetical protein